MVTPYLVPGPRNGVAPNDIYVRRFWVAAIGPAAVADLLRLVAAARRNRSIPCPIHLAVLLSEGLATRVGASIGVPETIPRLDLANRRRLAPALRRELAEG